MNTGKKYLVTTDSWFIGPDGKQYRAAWGKCTILKTEDIFDFVPRRPDTNWYIKLGQGSNSIIIGGCQIHFAIECLIKPTCLEGSYVEKETKRIISYNNIYFTE